MFNSYDDANENKDNIKKGKIFTHNDIKISEYIKEVYCILKERKPLLPIQ